MPPLKKSSEIQYLQVLHPWIQPTMDKKYLEKKNSKKFQKAKLEFSPLAIMLYLQLLTLY